MRPTPRRTAPPHDGSREHAASHSSAGPRSAGRVPFADLSGAPNTVLQRLVRTGADPRAVRPSGAAVGRLQRWKIETLEKNKPGEFKKLMDVMDGVNEQAKRAQLSALAEFTDNAPQLAQLLDATTGTGKAATLLKVLKLTVGYSGLAPLLEISQDPRVIGELLDLEPSPMERASLRQLHKRVGNVDVLKDMLRRMTGDQKCTDLLNGIDRAGGVDALTRLAPLTADLGVIVSLLRKPGIETGAALEEFIPLARDGETLLKLFDLSGAGPIKAVLSQQTYKKAAYDVVKTALSRYVVEGQANPDLKTVSTKPIRFTQNTCSNTTGTYKVRDNIAKLKSDKAWHIPGDPIRVFVKKPAMNAWGALGEPNAKNQPKGDPKNLEDGLIYSLDNRRLYAYKQANRQIPKPQMVPDNVVKAERWKFTTNNRGASIKLQG